MIYELRIYEVMPGRMPDLHKGFASVTTKYFEKHGIKVVGFWTQDIGVSNELVYITAFESLAHREKAWAALTGDAEWHKARADLNIQGIVVAKVTNKILRPTAYSPLQ